MTWRRDDAHSKRILGPKNRPLASPEVLAEFARTHWFCQVCGLAGEHTIHHIIGGRGGRSDDACNLLFACWLPCHSVFADMTINLAIVLTMKLRAGEMTPADVERLEMLNGKNLPDFAPIPEEMMVTFERNRPEVMANSHVAHYVHSWSRVNPESFASIRPLDLDAPDSRA